MRDTDDAVFQLVVDDRGDVEIVIPGEGKLVLDEEGWRACRAAADELIRPVASDAPEQAPRFAGSLVWLLGAVLIAVILGSFWALGRGVSSDQILPVVEKIESFIHEILEGTLGGFVGAALAYLFLKRRDRSERSS